MFSKSFWKQAAERAIKSAVQALAGSGLLAAVSTLHFDWRLALGAMLGGAVLSLASSIVTSGVGQPNSPSAVKTTAN